MSWIINQMCLSVSLTNISSYVTCYAHEYLSPIMPHDQCLLLLCALLLSAMLPLVVAALYPYTCEII